jgi:phosphoenolpyruvate-protein phosphotransferase
VRICLGSPLAEQEEGCEDQDATQEGTHHVEGGSSNEGRKEEEVVDFGDQSTNPSIFMYIKVEERLSSKFFDIETSTLLPSILTKEKLYEVVKRLNILMGKSESLAKEESFSIIDEIERQKNLFKSTSTQRVYLGQRRQKPFSVAANLGMVAHTAQALESGADEVGLYRTEFPFLVRNNLPTEEEQFETYRRVLEIMKDREVIFRTLDIGSDKNLSYLNLPHENNPALGWRAVRFSLERKDLFRIQLRALLKASVYGKMKIMLPMVTSVDQVVSTCEVIESAKKELSDENIRFAKNIPLGVMIEVPGAVEIASKLAKYADFFSLGTNDLTQYALAVDRTNPMVAHLFDSFHPAVLKMIFYTIRQGHTAGIPVSVCGDMAAQPLLAALLIGLGIDCLSMNPSSIPRIKHLVRHIKLKEVSLLAMRCLKQDSGTKIKLLLQTYFKQNGLNNLMDDTLTF